MCEIKTRQALKLKRYIHSLENFKLIEPKNCPYGNHIGAVLTDTILQSGLNYNTVVRPRVESIICNYPTSDTLSDFNHILKSTGYDVVLKWKHQEKITRLNSLITTLIKNNINTIKELILFLEINENVNLIKRIKGIGNKTCDYLMKLLGFDIIPVDRHIKSFLENADIRYVDYNDIKLIVSYTADFMSVSRRCLDYSIWCYMSSLRQKITQPAGAPY